MTRSQIISWVFALLLTVTIVNLLYKPRWLALWQGGARPWHRERWGALATDPFTHAQCSLRGFRCPDGEPCDCRTLCPLDDFLPFRVESSDAIVVLDRQLAAGTYCLPREGVQSCDRRHQIAVYTLSGWTCVDRHHGVFRNSHPMACYHPMAANPELNVLVDKRTGVGVGASHDVTDFHERLPDGTRRYECRCDSLDLRGNRMVRTLPFMCSVDYCLEDVEHAPTLGWDGTACQCGPYPRETPGDPTSPCRLETTRIEGNKTLHMRIECTSRKTFDKKAWYCPPPITSGVLAVEEMVHVGDKPTDFVAQHYRDLESMP